MSRYFACLAYETGVPFHGLRLLASELRRAPVSWIRDRRDWLVAAACLARTILSEQAIRQIRQMK